MAGPACLVYCPWLGQAVQITNRNLLLVWKRRHVGLPHLKMQAHHAAVPSFPSVLGQLAASCTSSSKTQGNVWGCTNPIPKFSADVYKKAQQSPLTVAECGKTTRQDLNQKAKVSKKPVNTSFVLESKLAGRFSSNLKQVEAPLPQQPAESQDFELHLKYTRVFSVKRHFTFPIFQYNQKLISWGVTWQPPSTLK